MEALHLMKLARQLNLNLKGIAFHVGSPCKEPAAYISYLKIAKLLMLEGRKLNLDMDTIDIGGGF